MMVIIIPQRPAAILVTGLEGGWLTESAWLSSLNSYGGTTARKRTRVSPSYYPADPLTQTNGREAVRQDLSTFIETKSNHGGSFRVRRPGTPPAE